MAKSTRIDQVNEKGNNIGNDLINGDKIADSIIGKIIGNGTVANFNWSFAKRPLTPEDEKEFGEYVHEDRVPEYKNLLNRIGFHCDLGQFRMAKKFVDEANAICHNHHILLSYNGLCEYTTTQIKDLITEEVFINEIIHLFEKAKELRPDSEYYLKLAPSVAVSFYEIQNDYIKKIVKVASTFFKSNREYDYYHAISKHLNHLRNCFLIYNDTEYLKDFIFHLCGHKGYPWFNIDDGGNIVDYGEDFFEGGATKKLKELISMVKESDHNFEPPIIKYGDYFKIPLEDKDLNVRRRENLKVLLIGIIVLIIIISMIVASGMSLDMIFILIIYPMIIWGLSHQFNNSELSLFKRLANWVMRKIGF